MSLFDAIQKNIIVDIHESEVNAPCCGMTPLLWVSVYNRLEIIEKLCVMGANVNATNFAGWTPLHYTILNNNPKAVRLLCERGAQTQIATHIGKTIWDMIDDPLLLDALRTDS